MLEALDLFPPSLHFLFYVTSQSLSSHFFSWFCSFFSLHYFSFCFCCLLPFTLSYAPLPLLNRCIRGCFIYSIRMAEGLGVCVPHTQINFSSASGTKQSAMLIVASMCAYETYRAHLSSTSLPFLGDIFVLTLPPLCQSLCTSDEVWTQWVMAMCISLAAKWRKLKQIVLSVCRSLLMIQSCGFLPLLSLILSPHISLPLSCSFFFFVCHRTIVLLRGCSYISGDLMEFLDVFCSSVYFAIIAMHDYIVCFTFFVYNFPLMSVI